MPSASLPPLRPGVHVAYPPGGLVFLDVDRDAYFCVYDAEPAAIAHDGPIIASAEVIAQVGHAGLLARSVELVPAPVLLPMPQWRQPPTPLASPARLRDILSFAFALVVGSFERHVLPFRRLITKPSRPTLLTRTGRTSEAAIIASRFERLCMLLPFRMPCLWRSSVLRRWLRLHRIGCDWVFGVALFPFEAHCWLAIGDDLIGERVDRVRGLMPILITRHDA